MLLLRYSYGILCLLQIFLNIEAIVNPQQESANMVIYMRKPSELISPQWQQGVDCSLYYARAFFERYSDMTRALNLLYTISPNLSNPARYIERAILPILHNSSFVIRGKTSRFRVSVINEQERLNMTFFGNFIPTDFYIIIADNVQSFVRLISTKVVRLANWNPLAFMIIVYNNVEDYNNETMVVRAISMEMRKHFVERFSVLYAQNPDLYVFLINNYLNPENCRTISWKKLGECRNGVPKPERQLLALNIERFVKSYGKMNCTFRVCATDAQPFVANNCTTGIELQLLQVIRDQLKLKINFTCSHLSRGTLKESGKWTGLLGKLSEGVCDMAMGGFYPDNEVTNHFWVSQTYMEDSHTWFIKKSNPNPPWKALLTIFKEEVWICFVATLIASCMSWYFLFNIAPEPKNHKGLALAAINAIAVSFCVSVHERPLYYTCRLFFFVLALYGLNFMAIYTSRLIVVFKDPGYMYQIGTFEELYNARIPYGGPAENRDWFIDDDWIEEFYNDTELFHPEHENLVAVVNGERVLLGGRAFMLNSNLSELIYPFTTNVFSSPLQFFMTYGAPYQNDINMRILFCNDFGLTSKIEKDFQYNNTYLKHISKERPDFKGIIIEFSGLWLLSKYFIITDQVIVLTVQHFQGPFAVLIVGITASILVFVGEIYVNCMKKEGIKKQNLEKSRHKKMKFRTKRDQHLKHQNQTRGKKHIKLGLIKRRSDKSVVVSRPWFY